MIDLAAPRAPAAPLSAALYESHYLTATDPAGGRALWLRHTALKRPGQAARPTVWLTWFDRSAASPLALRVTDDRPLGEPGEAWAQSGLGSFGPVTAMGAMDGARWSLGWTGIEAEVLYLPHRRLYDRPLPRSGGVALVPVGLISGALSLSDGTEIVLEGWPGMVGHNWGSEHAEQWWWLHGAGLSADGRGWLDLVLVRVRIGPLLTPWIAAGAVALDRERRRPAPGRRVRVSGTGRGVRVALTLTGGEVLELETDAPPASTVTWDYASPSGAGRTVRHCTVADVTVRLSGRPIGAPPGSFAVEAGGPA